MLPKAVDTMISGVWWDHNWGLIFYSEKIEMFKNIYSTKSFWSVEVYT